MELDRKAFLAALQTVAPALSTKELLPLLKMMWFSGSVVRATEGTIGIEAPCQTAWTGGIQGAVLLGFIESLNRDTLKAEIGPGNPKPGEATQVTFVSENARIKLPLEPLANEVWPFPPSNAEPEVAIDLDNTWREAIEFAMTSVTTNSVHEEPRGITFEAAKKHLNLYATDRVSIAWAQLPQGKWHLDRLTVPGDFFKEVLRLMAKDSTFEIRSNTAEASNEAGVKVYSRLFEVAKENQMQFALRLKERLPDTDMVPLPDGLKAAFERVELLKDNKDGIPAKLTFVDKDLLVVEASSSYGDLKEELYLDSEHPEQPPLNLTPSVLLRGLAGRDQFIVGNGCVILNGPPHLTYMVAAHKA